MLDRIHAADDGAADRFGAVRMSRHRESIVVRGCDDGPDLLDRELGIVAARAFIQHAARGHDLDQIVAGL